ncbi:MAG: tetratricopeptide repeat protein [Candidatus Latescibacteria bacterium]|nr:tetratricopeptide repeat protein [bacterium]MBD3423310.1 tetratricopeptide repeat protein [Candidatus Latescibacterota bacterium]
MKRYLFPISVFLILLVTAGVAAAGENEDFRFADKLRRDGMYVAAAEEYLRFSDRYPESTLRPRAVFLAGESWMQSGRAEDALETFQLYLEQYPEGEKVCRARFYRGRIMKKLKMYQEAASEFLIINDQYPECALAGRALFEAGESLLYAGNPQEGSLVLKKLLKMTENRELLPVARYTLALALINMERELEAYAQLETLVERYPDSPVAGMALLKLGEDAVASGDNARGAEYFNRLLDSRREESLREKGMFRLIDLYSGTGENEKLLSLARRYLSTYEEGERRDRVYSLAIKGSHGAERPDRTIDLIESYREEFPAADSTGWTLSLKSRILAEEGRTEEALAELNRMEQRYPGAVYTPEILILKAELSNKLQRYNDAARFYRISLTSGLPPARKGRVLASLAGLYSGGLRDTAAAVRLWEEAASTSSPGLREKALFRAAEGKESTGDLDGAVALYRTVIREFPEGEWEEVAGRRLELLELTPRNDRDLVDSIHTLLLTGGPRGALLVEAATAFLEHSYIDRALELLEESYPAKLSAADSARREYYMGEAYHSRYRRSVLSGESGGDDLSRALSHWREGVSEHGSTRWGEKSYRSYLEVKFGGWDLSRKLSGLDRYMKYYREPESMIWALMRKCDLIYGAALKGSAWAPDSALKVCDQLEAQSLPECDMAEITRKRGYLRRMQGEDQIASELLRKYLADYPGCGCDPRAWYDLGEIRISMKQYRPAMEAYRGCLDCATGRMRMNCRLRKGDCHFYLKDYESAGREYAAVSRLSPGSTVAAVADFRYALALEKLGEDQAADSIYSALLDSGNPGRSVRVRAMEKLGRNNYINGNLRKAGEYYRELVRISGSPEHRIMYAEILLEQGEAEKAQDHFSRLLGSEGVDSARVLAGRALARYRSGRIEQADFDLALLREDYPGDRRIPEIVLLRGRMLIEEDQFESARNLFESLASEYPDYQDESLYYLALCDIQSGGYARAEEKLVRHLRDAPHSSLACAASFKLAFVQSRMEKLNLAARNYSLAAESCADQDLKFRALKNLAEIYQKMEDWEKASSVWFRIVENYPARDDIVDLLFNLGFAYGQSGKYRLARDVYSRITSITAEEAKLGRAYYWIGINLKNMGHYREAARQFLRVPYLRTGGMWGVTARLEAAGCYRQMGRYDEAAGIYRSVLESHGRESDWGRIAAGYLEKMNNGQKDTREQQ